MEARMTTQGKLADEIIANLDSKYDLVYVDRGDQLTDTQVAAIVKGDTDALWSETEEFESESRHRSTTEIIKEAAKDIVQRWERDDDHDYTQLLEDFEYSPDWERVRDELCERDSGSWVRDLINNTPKVLLRISVLDEDNAYDHVDLQPEQVLTDVKLPVTERNLKVMADTLAECSPEFSILLGYWIVGADIGDLYDLDVAPETVIEIVNPHLYLGNPFAGSGWISEEPFEGVVRIKREDLRSDKDAFGYSVNEVYGGLSPSSFEATIRQGNPLRPAFLTLHDQHAGRNGQAFEVVRKITLPDATHDAEVLPMYVIRFADGEEIEAFTDEVEEPSNSDGSPE